MGEERIIKDKEKKKNRETEDIDKLKIGMKGKRKTGEIQGDEEMEDDEEERKLRESSEE